MALTAELLLVHLEEWQGCFLGLNSSGEAEIRLLA